MACWVSMYSNYSDLQTSFINPFKEVYFLDSVIDYIGKVCWQWLENITNQQTLPMTVGVTYCIINSNDILI